MKSNNSIQSNHSIFDKLKLDCKIRTAMTISKGTTKKGEEKMFFEPTISFNLRRKPDEKEFKTDTMIFFRKNDKITSRSGCVKDINQMFYKNPFKSVCRDGFIRMKPSISIKFMQNKTCHLKILWTATCIYLNESKRTDMLDAKDDVEMTFREIDES